MVRPPIPRNDDYLTTPTTAGRGASGCRVLSRVGESAQRREPIRPADPSPADPRRAASQPIARDPLRPPKQKPAPFRERAFHGMEARGFEPRSEMRFTTASTCVVYRLRSPDAGQ